MTIERIQEYVSDILRKLDDVGLSGVYCTLNCLNLSESEKRSAFKPLISWYLAELIHDHGSNAGWAVTLAVTSSAIDCIDDQNKLFNDLCCHFWTMVGNRRCPGGIPCCVCSSL